MGCKAITLTLEKEKGACLKEPVLQRSGCGKLVFPSQEKKDRKRIEMTKMVCTSNSIELDSSVRKQSYLM